MIRLFQVYYPVRTLVLLGGELMLLFASFVAATVIRLGADSELTLRYENGLQKLLIISILAILSAYYFDLYSPQNLRSKNETYFRLLLLFGSMCLVLSAVGYFFPEFFFGHGIFTLGMMIATMSVLCWRGLYVWMLKKPFLREQVYVLGSGPKAARFVDAIRERTDLGMDVVGWTGASNSLETMESLATAVELISNRQIPRVIVAVVMRLESVRFVGGRRRIVGHQVIGHAHEARRSRVAGGFPRFLEHQILDRDELQRPIRLGLVDQHRRRQEISMHPLSVDARVGRGGDPEQVRSEIVDAHGDLGAGAAHHRRRFAHAARRRDVALGQSDLDVTEAFGSCAHRRKVGVGMKRSGIGRSERERKRRGDNSRTHDFLLG